MNWKDRLIAWLRLGRAAAPLPPAPKPYAPLEMPYYFREFSQKWGLSFFQDPDTKQIEVRQGDAALARYTLPTNFYEYLVRRRPYYSNFHADPGFMQALFNGDVHDQNWLQKHGSNGSYMEALLTGKADEWAQAQRANIPYSIKFQAIGSEEETVTVIPETGDETGLLYHRELEELFRGRIEKKLPPATTAVMAVAIAHLELALSEALNRGIDGYTNNDNLVAAHDLEGEAIQAIEMADSLLELAVDTEASRTKINVESTRVEEATA